MSGFNPIYTNRGNYKCPYCNHSIWKRAGYAERHILEQHAMEAENSELKSKVEQLEREKQQIKEAYTPKPAPKTEQKYWHSSVYCQTCCIVIGGAGIPVGQTIESTPHSVCGNRTLLRVVNGQEMGYSS